MSIIRNRSIVLIDNKLLIAMMSYSEDKTSDERTPNSPQP